MTVAFVSVEIVPAGAVKVLLVAPAATVTDPGTDRAPVLLESETAAPPVPATLESVTVQVELPAVARLAGVHESSVNVGVVNCNVTEVFCELPFRLAVTVAVWVLKIDPAVAVKAPVVAPEATVTDDGTLSNPELLESPTEVLAVAALVSVTVQEVLAPEPMLEGEHHTELTSGGATSAITALRALLL